MTKPYLWADYFLRSFKSEIPKAKAKYQIKCILGTAFAYCQIVYKYENWSGELLLKMKAANVSWWGALQGFPDTGFLTLAGQIICVFLLSAQWNVFPKAALCSCKSQEFLHGTTGGPGGTARPSWRKQQIDPKWPPATTGRLVTTTKSENRNNTSKYISFCCSLISF